MRGGGNGTVEEKCEPRRLQRSGHALNEYSRDTLTPLEALARMASASHRSLRETVEQLVETTWARRHEPRFHAQVALAVLFAAALTAFAHITEDYLTGDPIVRWDVEFSRWLHEHSSAPLRSLFEVVTWGGNVAFLALLTVGVALYLLRRRRMNEAALLCVAALGIEVVNGALKLLFHRPRPELAFVHLDTYSFPSGHAAGAAAIYAVVFYLLARSADRSRRVACAVGYVALVVAIGFSRLYLEVHYLSDVLAGISLGAAWATACLFLYETRSD
jgi:membrane-associated phospholipid phosphatase